MERAIYLDQPDTAQPIWHIYWRGRRIGTAHETHNVCNVSLTDPAIDIGGTTFDSAREVERALWRTLEPES